jgi:hypothetical protein
MNSTREKAKKLINFLKNKERKYDSQRLECLKPNGEHQSQIQRLKITSMSPPSSGGFA